jgi:hypothetical protein
MKMFEIGPLERLVSGCVRNAINAHGPITKELIGSATDRIVGQLRAQMLVLQDLPGFLEEIQAQIVIETKKDLQELTEKYTRLQEQERRFRKKCMENNIPLGD